MNNIHIDLYLQSLEGDVLHGTRTWPAVPRVGDFVTITFDKKLYELPVLSVYWGTTEDSRKWPGGCAVAVVLDGDLLKGKLADGRGGE